MAAVMPADDVHDRLRTELGRVADRLRSLGLARLERPAADGSSAGGSIAGGSIAGGSSAGGSSADGSIADGSIADGSIADGSIADRAHATCQRLADLAAASAGREPRSVPRLASHAAGDQVAVLGADVLAEGDAATVAQAAAELTALRRAL